ncbi:hypothetical protein [Aeromonas bivalvium]
MTSTFECSKKWGDYRRYLHHEVLAKLPADEPRDLHLSYLRLLLG